MKILSVASEIYPIIKTGGLADVAGALPLALAKHGIETTSLIPAYSAILPKLGKGKEIHIFKDLFGYEAKLLRHKVGELDIIALHCAPLFERMGGPYNDINGADFSDNWARFGALAKAAAEIASGAVKTYAPDLVHCHDWQAALAPVYMYFGNERAKKTPSIVTIHNIAFQGRFGFEIFENLGLPQEAFDIDGLEYYGDLAFLKGGLAKAWAINTVSPNYAQEIKTAEFGMGLEGLMNARSHELHGIINGIDYNIWNPATDKDLTAPFNHNLLSNRKQNRVTLNEIFGLKRSKQPLLCVISRLTWQKGMDVLIDAIDDIIKMGVKIAVLGSGDAALEAALMAARNRNTGSLGVKIGYDEALSHLMQGGCDGILIPSRFEPCGLTQLYGLRYGCVPIVARKGGLTDTIIDANEAALNAGVATGFQLDNVTKFDLLRAIERVKHVFSRNKDWAKIQKNGMKSDFSWEKSAQKYVEIYRGLIAQSGKI